MNSHSVLLILVGIIGASLHRARRAVRKAEDLHAQHRFTAQWLMPFELYDEPS